MAEFQQPVNYSAANVRDLRSMAGMSRRELVEKLSERGVSLQQTSLRRIEEGQQSVKIEEAQAFSDIFNIDLVDFITKPVNPVEARLQATIQGVDHQLERLTGAAKSLIAFRLHILRLLQDEDTPPAEQSASVRELVKIYDELKPTADACIGVFETPAIKEIPDIPGTKEHAIGEYRKIVEERYGEG